MSDWRVFGESVLGAAHRRSGLPNQDALGFLQKEDLKLPLVLAMADGHGSPKCFRSQEGSRLAVEVAREVAQELLLAEDVSTDQPVLQELVEQKVPTELLNRWRQRVRSHHEEKPFTVAEVMKLEKTAGDGARTSLDNPLHAYGSTILMVVVTPRFIAFVQLGDGDLVGASETGVVTRPLPEDPRLFANETTSLSSARLA